MKIVIDVSPKEIRELLLAIPPTPTKEVSSSQVSVPSDPQPEPVISVREQKRKLQEALHATPSFQYFADFCDKWLENFEDKDAPQPDRLALISEMGGSPHAHPILLAAQELGGLQRLVEAALIYTGTFNQVATSQDTQQIQTLNQIAGNMVQVSHAGFPDLGHAFDYGTKWTKIFDERG